MSPTCELITQRQREREKQTQRHADTKKQRQRQRHRHRHTDTQTDFCEGLKRQRHRRRHRHRHKDRQRHRLLSRPQTDRGRQRDSIEGSRVVATTPDKTNFKKCLNQVVVGVAPFNAANFTTEDGNKT